MVMDITQALLNAQSANGGVRNLGENNLLHFEQHNRPHFLVSLSLELANDGKPAQSRRLAGLILKNSLDAKDVQRKQELVHKWLALDAAAKSQVKGAIMQALSSSVTEASHTAAQVLAKIAAIELPSKQWPDLIGCLLSNLGGDSVELKKLTLEALGYICEAVPHNALAQEEVKSIVTAVVQAMSDTELNSDVRLSATRALCNALDFAQTNFENDVERDYIMRMVCEATMSLDVRVRQAAFECLVSIASTYYAKLQPYMSQINSRTRRAVTQDEEPVALQAIEFWSAVCDQEIEILTGDSDVAYLGLIEKAADDLVVWLALSQVMTVLELQKDAWNLAKASLNCCALVHEILTKYTWFPVSSSDLEASLRTWSRLRRCLDMFAAFV